MWGRCRRRACRWGLGLVVPFWRGCGEVVVRGERAMGAERWWRGVRLWGGWSQAALGCVRGRLDDVRRVTLNLKWRWYERRLRRALRSFSDLCMVLCVWLLQLSRGRFQGPSMSLLGSLESFHLLHYIVDSTLVPTIDAITVSPRTDIHI
jgi:hypothetical protein